MSLIERKQMVLDDGWTGASAGVGDYIALLKPRVMSLVVFTAAVGMIVAPVSIHPVLAAISLICIAVGAGASGALNMWYDADIDAVMSRTANRPIPAGRVTPDSALAIRRHAGGRVRSCPWASLPTGFRPGFSPSRSSSTSPSTRCG